MAKRKRLRSHSICFSAWAVSIAFYADGASAAEIGTYLGRITSTVGYEHTYDLDLAETAHALWIFRQQQDWSDAEPMSARFHLQYQIQVDTAEGEAWSQRAQGGLDKLIAFVEKPWGPFTLSLGQQEVSWGENLLMPILDLVNPRDFRNPKGYYDPASKMPVPMINLNYKEADWTAQLIAVPQAIRSRQPDTVADFGVRDERKYRLGLDGEYGGTVGTRIESLDAKLYYWSAWPRVPAYTFTPFSGSSDIQIEEQRVDTSGLSFSYAEASWLLRGDFAHHLHYPATQIGTKIERSTLDQMILGWSWTSESLQTFGAELHSERWEKLPSAYTPGPWVEERRSQRFYSWLGVNSSLRLWGGACEPQLLGLRGINTEDRLLRLVIPWNYNEGLTVAAEYQNSHASSNSPKILLSQQKTLSLRLAYSW